MPERCGVILMSCHFLVICQFENFPHFLIFGVTNCTCHRYNEYLGNYSALENSPLQTDTFPFSAIQSHHAHFFSLKFH